MQKLSEVSLLFSLLRSPMSSKRTGEPIIAYLPADFSVENPEEIFAYFLFQVMYYSRNVKDQR